MKREVAIKPREQALPMEEQQLLISESDLWLWELLSDGEVSLRSTPWGLLEMISEDLLEERFCSMLHWKAGTNTSFTASSTQPEILVRTLLNSSFVICLNGYKKGKIGHYKHFGYIFTGIEQIFLLINKSF